MLDKHRVLAVTKCDLLDEELIEMLKENLPDRFAGGLHILGYCG